MRQLRYLSCYLKTVEWAQANTYSNTGLTQLFFLSLKSVSYEIWLVSNEDFKVN